MNPTDAFTESESQTLSRTLDNPPTNVLVLLRFTLLIATSYLVIAHDPLQPLAPAVVWLLAGALFSNMLLARFLMGLVGTSWLTAALMVFDTAWVSAVLVMSNFYSQEFFYIYFFLLILAAIGENLRMIILGAVLAAIAYLSAISVSGPGASPWKSDILVQIPFLFAVAIFYGYQVERVRRQRQLAYEEGLVSESLREELEVRKCAEDLLRSSNQNLETVSRRKTHSISIVSHELRTPLTCIQGSLDLLAEGEAGSLSEAQIRFIEMARRNVARLSSLIRDLLDLSHIEAGKFKTDLVRTDLGELLENALEQVRPQLEEKELELQIDIRKDLPEVMADTSRMRQVVLNLVGNAIKFTPPGERIIATAHVCGRGVEIGIEDTGIGIGPEDRAKISQPFFQVENVSTRCQSGMGLGLSIVNKILDCHSSRLEVESELGVGTRFSFVVRKAPKQTDTSLHCNNSVASHPRRRTALSSERGETRTPDQRGKRIWAPDRLVGDQRIRTARA